MSKTLALIGSGAVGGTLARLAVTAGWHVVVSNSRGPQTLADLVAELGDRASAATPEQAAAAADLVVVSIPLLALGQLPAAALTGKTVIDATNYVPDRDGRIAELDDLSLTASELVQRQLPDSHVVKAFNNLIARHLGELPRPAGAADRSALPVAADDDAAKAEAVRLLDELGYDAVDLGKLAESWRSEPGTPLFVLPYSMPFPAGLDLRQAMEFVYSHTGVPAPVARIAELASLATRGPAGIVEA
ncbi:NADPH-dependent F420 reductase [Kutzneria sp. CA-103260]|uniref:NADPH-dependent F420 reductase n=1 Tax=Kutzneria sp. CA-103260 TaxID=2802641 RepID=UPI001BA97F60|nr:NAD(P)-binding domain-containing protein [Kutzneria sp. CA-103260]QUQ64143.1 oxidoreductase [Kutzneria sp. CA-103260]